MGQSLTRLPEPRQHRSTRKWPLDTQPRTSKRSSLLTPRNDGAELPLRPRRKHDRDSKPRTRQSSPTLREEERESGEFDTRAHTRQFKRPGKNSRRRHSSDRANLRSRQSRKTEAPSERRTRGRRTNQPHEPQSQTDRNILPSKAHSRKGKSGIRVSVKTLAPTQECLICVESCPVSRFPSRPPTSQCSHPPQVCRPCLRKWIRSEFKSRVWDQLNCPECSSKMQHDDVKEFAPYEVFRKYDALSTKVALEAIPGFRWCIAKGCKSGQVHEGELTPKFKCVACKASHCAIHEVKWHKGETCAEYDYRTDGKQKKAEDAASKKLIQETAKKCPGCAWNIEKNNGCDHMTCSKCKHEFCWACLAPYGPIRKQGNQMHRPKCEYYYSGED